MIFIVVIVSVYMMLVEHFVLHNSLILSAKYAEYLLTLCGVVWRYVYVI